MGRYCLLQCKRIARYLPGALLAMLVLLGGLMAVFSAMLRQDAPKNQKFQVAMVGTADDLMVQMGLTALRTFDSTQLSMEIVEMTETEAHAALEKGSIGAYVVIPEGFVDEAMKGHILPLKFVSTTGAASVVSVFKEEVTQVVSLLLLESQRGVYGMQGAMKSQDIGGRGKKMDALALTYVEYILARDNTYSLQELGISDALGLEDYLLCGLFVLFLMLACLPFAPLWIRRDMALERMFSARGHSPLLQTLSDLLLYTAALGLLATLIALPAEVLLSLQLDLAALVPVIFMVCSLSFLLYTLCADLISGVLVQFFTALALCFVSGCMYPVFFFPLSVQKLAGWLPTGAARSQLTACLSGESYGQVWLLWVYGLAFSLLAAALRLRRIKEDRV